MSKPTVTTAAPKRGETHGILRLDLSIPRRNSGGSVDFRVPEREGIQVDPPSPQPSVDRLSVTFRDRSDCSDTSVTVNVFDPGSPPAVSREMVTFTTENVSAAVDDDEDYSMSVTQILNRRDSTRRASQRRRKRRPSSPFTQQEQPETDGRRRSSVFTNSSMETAVTIEEGTAQEQIFENIRLHKEVLSNVKLQPWSMRRKMKLVKQAKKYVKKHEGELQERLALSKNTKDIWARFDMVMVKYFRRELANMMTQLIPWELRIKEIESHFGSAVASYFTFLRWMFWVNLVISVILACFVMLLIGDRTKSSNRMQMTEEEKATATYLMTMWDFEGALKYSPIFYGFYSHKDKPGAGYRLPFAYFMAGLAVYVYSFVATLRRMAENSRMSKLSEKDDECAFTWKLFSGWDYMIGNAETAHNRVASLVLGFKESLLEETEKKRDEKNWRVLGLRVLVNLLVLGLLTISAYIVFVVVKRSIETVSSDSWWRQNEITVSLTIISTIFPIFFEVLGMLEGYHPRKSLRIQLARIMVLNLLNLYTLIFSLFWKISTMVSDLQKLKPNATEIFSTAATSTVATTPFCYDVEIECSTAAVVTTLLTTTLLPLVMSTMKNTTSELTTEMPFNFSSSTFDTTSTLDDPTRPTFDYDDDDETTTSMTTSENFPTTEMTPTENHSRKTDHALLLFTLRALTGGFGKKTTTAKPKSTTNEMTTFTEETSTEPTTTEFPKICYTRKCEQKKEIFSSYTSINKTLKMDEKAVKKKLSVLCWETMFGQELVKLTVMDLAVTVISILLVDFVRAVLVRILNHCWCWDLEKTFPQYGDFKIAENILHLVNNQGMVWMGMFFSPGLPAINLIKLIVMMYLRSWAVLTCNVPHEVVFRASRSNNFYLALLLTMLFLCVLPVGFAIVWIEPSWHCGPFSSYNRIYHIFTDYLHRALPASFQAALDYIASPAIVIPLLMVLILIIYYLVSLTSSLREANADLKIQLRRERTEERRKMFQLVDKKNRKGSGDSDAFSKWKNILPDYSPNPETKNEIEKISEPNRKKELISRLLKRAISSGTSDEESVMPEETVPVSRKRSPLLDALKKTIQEKPAVKRQVQRTSSTPQSSTQRSSLASDKIPVIKISKTESEENILDKKKTSPKSRFRQAVTKHIQLYRNQKKNEKLAKLKLYARRKDEKNDQIGPISSEKENKTNVIDS